MEGGFKRYHKGSKASKAAYGNFSATAKDQKPAYKAFLQTARKSVLKTPGLTRRERGARLKAVAEQARRQFPEYVGERTARRQARESSVQANNAFTKGAWRSKAIAKTMMPMAVQTVRIEALAAAEAALKGAP